MPSGVALVFRTAVFVPERARSAATGNRITLAQLSARLRLELDLGHLVSIETKRRTRQHLGIPTFSCVALGARVHMGALHDTAVKGASIAYRSDRSGQALERRRRARAATARIDTKERIERHAPITTDVGV